MSERNKWADPLAEANRLRKELKTALGDAERNRILYNQLAEKQPGRDARIANLEAELATLRRKGCAADSLFVGGRR